MKMKDRKWELKINSLRWRVFFRIRAVLKSTKLARLIFKALFFFGLQLLLRRCRIILLEMNVKKTNATNWRHFTQCSTETCNQRDAKWMSVARTKTHNCRIKNSIWLLFMKHSAVVSTPFYQTWRLHHFAFRFFRQPLSSTEFCFEFFSCFIYVSRLFFFIIIYSIFFLCCHSFSCCWIIYPIFFLLFCSLSRSCLIIYDVLLINILIWCCLCLSTFWRFLCVIHFWLI